MIYSNGRYFIEITEELEKRRISGFASLDGILDLNELGQLNNDILLSYHLDALGFHECSIDEQCIYEMIRMR